LVILVFDVGNTELSIGLFNDTELRGHWRVMTDVARTADEFGVLIRSLLAAGQFAHDSVESVAIGSVVPRVTAPLSEACVRYFAVGEPLIVDAGAGLPITLDVDEPLTVGADRIINTLAASRLYEHDAVVVDMGTANTFDCITAAGVFIGGVIAPGVLTSAETLTRRTSKLPATELSVPARVIGRRTEECIRAGVLFGAADAIDGIVRRIKATWPGTQVPIVIATGGFADTMASLCTTFDRVEPHLTLQGLQIAHTLLRGPRRPIS
jgi:type III pantothenate kinase